MSRRVTIRIDRVVADTAELTEQDIRRELQRAVAERLAAGGWQDTASRSVEAMRDQVPAEGSSLASRVAASTAKAVSK